MADQPAVVAADFSEMLRRIFSQANDPLSAKQILDRIPQAVRPTPEELDTALAGDGIFRYPGARGTAAFLNQSPQDVAAQKLLRKLQGTPLTQSEAVGPVQKLKSLSSALSRKDVDQIFTRLVQAGKIHKLPPYLGARTPLYSTIPARPADYLGHALRKLSEKLKLTPLELLDAIPQVAEELPKSQSTSNSTRQSSPVSDVAALGHLASEDDLGPRLLQAVQEINPRAADGDLVSVADLRNRLDWQLDKELFDRAVLKLAEERRVALHAFDRAALLSPEERVELVADEHGRFFNAISLWRNS